MKCQAETVLPTVLYHFFYPILPAVTFTSMHLQQKRDLDPQWDLQWCRPKRWHNHEIQMNTAYKHLEELSTDY